MDGDSNDWKMYLIMKDKILEIPEPINYDEMCEEPKYNVPNKIIETWAEKACRYDAIANAIFKECYQLYNINSEDYTTDEQISDLIWSMITYVLSPRLDINKYPYAEDYLANYLI